MGDLVIERCLPSERATEILDLFRRAGHPEFAKVFERVYKPREQSGLRSWVGFVNGKAVLHISATLQTFSDGSRPLVGAMPSDLMADEGYRDFWNPIKLVRKMVDDVKKEGRANFFFTQYVKAAEGVFKAAGFKPFASIRHCVMPLLWPYPSLRRLLHRQPMPPLTAYHFDDTRVQPILTAFRPSGFFRPVPGPEFYNTRMPRENYPAGTWLIAGDPSQPEALVLVSPIKSDEVAIVDILTRDASPRLAGLISAVAGWARKEWFRKVSLNTLEESRIGEIAQRAGCLVRPGAHTLLVLPINRAEITPSEDWLFTPFVLSTW